MWRLSGDFTPRLIQRVGGTQVLRAVAPTPSLFPWHLLPPYFLAGSWPGLFSPSIEKWPGFLALGPSPSSSRDSPSVTWILLFSSDSKGRKLPAFKGWADELGLP